MVLVFIGLGLGDPNDITVKGQQTVQKSDFVYLETYTSVFPGYSREKLEAAYGVCIIEADRDLVEAGCEEMIERAKAGTVSFLVVGDPLCATTHTDLYLRAKDCGVQVQVIHNASIMNAISSTGLQLYRFGETVSIPYWDDNWKPTSFIEKIEQNLSRNLHTLCLLDIKVKERSIENMMRCWAVFEPPRFMSVAEAIDQLLEAKPEYSTRLMVGVARIGSYDQTIYFDNAQDLKRANMGPPLHSLVIPAEIHDCELKFLNQFIHRQESVNSVSDNSVTGC